MWTLGVCRQAFTFSATIMAAIALSRDAIALSMDASLVWYLSSLRHGDRACAGVGTGVGRVRRVVPRLSNNTGGQQP